MMLADTLAAFKKVHAGMSPRAMVVTPEAAVILAVQEGLPTVFDGVPIRIGVLPQLVKAGKGTSVVLAASTDALDRPCVIVLETDSVG